MLASIGTGCGASRAASVPAASPPQQGRCADFRNIEWWGPGVPRFGTAGGVKSSPQGSERLLRVAAHIGFTGDVPVTPSGRPDDE